MSGIYIPGMKMPKNCTGCDFNDGIYCSLISDNNYIKDMCIMGTRKADCPLVPVPPHGELCDKTALVNKIGENIDKAKDRSHDWWYACTVAYDFAFAAPTIIPASEKKEATE